MNPPSDIEESESELGDVGGDGSRNPPDDADQPDQSSDDDMGDDGNGETIGNIWQSIIPANNRRGMGPNGFRNLCFFYSALQQIGHIEAIYNYLKQHQYCGECNHIFSF